MFLGIRCEILAMKHKVVRNDPPVKKKPRAFVTKQCPITEILHYSD